MNADQFFLLQLVNIFNYLIKMCYFVGPLKFLKQIKQCDNFKSLILKQYYVKIIFFTYVLFLQHLFVNYIFVLYFEIQSNSVITNFMGPGKFVRYNRGSL
jgi:hypothetical protein